MVNFYKLPYNIFKLQHIISEGDKIMEQKTPFKELTFSQKIQYIWDYYKIPIFLVILLGWFLMKIHLISEEFANVANKYVFKVALPYMGIYKEYTPDKKEP